MEENSNILKKFLGNFLSLAIVLSHKMLIQFKRISFVANRNGLRQSSSKGLELSSGYRIEEAIPNKQTNHVKNTNLFIGK